MQSYNAKPLMTDNEIRILEKGTIECKDTTELLGSYVDNELSESLRTRVADHIATCPECQEGEERYREVIALAKTLPDVELTQGVSDRLRKALNQRLGLDL